jgi:hypothetical protein
MKVPSRIRESGLYPKNLIQMENNSGVPGGIIPAISTYINLPAKICFPMYPYSATSGGIGRFKTWFFIRTIIEAMKIYNIIEMYFLLKNMQNFDIFSF